MKNRLQFLVGCVLCLPLVLVFVAVMVDRFDNPKLTETELFDRWFPYTVVAAVPAFGGYVLVRDALDDDAGEE